MTPDALTEKQRYAREYYHRNAERIRAQKRDAYHSKATPTRKYAPKAEGEAVTQPKPAATPRTVALPVSPRPKVAKPAPRGPRTISARERLENMRIEKELGLYE
jgi:hypothetical protein